MLPTLWRRKRNLKNDFLIDGSLRAKWSFLKKIALKRSKNGIVIAKHVNETTGQECTKPIKLSDLGPENFSHTIPKGRDSSLRLVESNIEIVSRAWHYREHNGGILREVYKN